MRVAGTHGELTAGGRWVATLGVWHVNLNDDGGLLRAAVTESNAFYREHLTAATVRLEMGKGCWRWDGAAVERLDEGKAEIRLGGGYERE